MDRVSARERLRRTFDAAAGSYQAARPEYPDSLYSALLKLTGVRPEADALCEVGSASGKATLPLARRGFAITCVELGAALAAEARRNLAGFERVTVVNADFETWQPPALESFGLVFAATAWQRDRLYGEIRRRLALRADGLVRRHWGGVLHVARKLSGGAGDMRHEARGPRSVA